MRAPGATDLEGASSSPDPLIGTVINGKFRIQRAIARGGMGRIYYATQVPFDRPVALKVVQADTVNEEESQFLKRFLQEASILAKLQHPNVVMLFDYGRIESSAVEKFFIAMEYLDGETLGTRFKTRGVLPTAEVLLLARQILRGLREAHVRGIVHRDLKPSNIILVADSDGGDLVKLVDFGIGKVMEHSAIEQDLTQEGVMVGTPRYMAPEQFDGIVSPASDVYALGTLMFQALSGTLPFRGTTLSEFMVAKFAHAIPRIHEIAPQSDAPENLEAIILAMLARAPEERPTLEMLSMQLAHVEQEVFGSGAPRSLAASGPHLPLSMRSGAFGSITGSGPQPQIVGVPPSLDSNRVQSSRVPPTMIQQAPQGTMGLTPRPMATSARPPEKRSPVVAIAIVLGILVGLGGGGAWFMKTRASRAATVPTATATTAPVESAGPKDEPPTSFVLTIDSTPSGATVSEDDRSLGETPLSITIDRASVAGGARTFVVKKDGFVATTVTQGPSESSAKTMVSLSPVDPLATKKTTKKTGPPPGPGPGTGTKPPPTGGLDIRLNR